MIPTRIPINRPIPPLTYTAPEGLEPGVRVQVPLRTGYAVGVVEGPDPQPPSVELRPIQEVIDPFRLVPDTVWALMQFAATYYAGTTASLMPLCMSNTLRARWDEPIPGGSTLAVLRDQHRWSELQSIGAQWRSGTLSLPTLFHSRERRGVGVSEVHRTDQLPVGRSTDQQRKVLRCLEEHQGVLFEDELMLQAGVGASVLQTLEQKNLIVRLKRRDTVAPPRRAESFPSVTLNAEQMAVRAQIALEAFQVYLLYGVTGSGKTEVYLNAARDVIRQGKRVLWLVPEIGLTPRLLARLESAFPGVVGVGHAGLNASERQSDLIRSLQKDIQLFVGVRNAVFAPIDQVGLIVVDEEHESSYKSEEYPRIHARDLAIKRAQLEGCPIVLGSATPSLESWVAAQQGRYQLLTLHERPAGSQLPTVDVVDLREEYRQHRKRTIFSERLLTGLQATMDRGEQAMLLLNRRGWENFWLCRSCGKSLECVHCSLTMTYHKKAYRLRCHLCHYEVTPPEVCPACKEPHLRGVGEGTEQIEALMKTHFPHARILRIDRDTTSRRGELEAKLVAAERGDFNLLIGTQMIAKGHNFPHLTLVGILNADMGLKLPDFRAAEHTFQLLTQVAGRAGRAEHVGSVILQTYSPEHHAIRSALEQNFIQFSTIEIPFRETVAYPPFYSLALFRSEAADPDEARSLLMEIKTHLEMFKDLRILGPLPAPIFRMRDRFHMQLLVRSPQRHHLSQALERLNVLSLKGISLDRDPIHFG
ncbi:MAG: primosomal protein N' [Holophagaceae bacterium]